MRCLHLLGLLACTAACGDDDATTDDGSGGSGGQTTNEPPAWTDAPGEALTIGQGRTVALPLTVSDPEGTEVTAAVSAIPPGVEATIADGEIDIHVFYEGAQSGALQVALTDGDGQVALVDVAIEVLPIRWLGHEQWTTAEGPEEREHGAVVFDAAGQQAFVMQGSGYHPQFTQMLDDVWRYDLTTSAWEQVTPTGDVPIGAGSRRFAGAQGAGEGLLFGGYGPDPADAYDDLIRVRVEGQTLAFENVPQQNTPPARYLHGFAYDPVSDQYVLFGGVAGAIMGDTWTMQIVDGTAVWTEHEIAERPSARYGFFYGFDEEAGRLILFSGAQQPFGGNPVNPAPDTWALDVRTDPPVWTRIGDPNASPPGRRNGCAVWDPTGPRLFIFGGTPDAMTTTPGLFALDARPGKEGWSTLALDGAPQARSSGFGFFDGQRALMGFGNDASLYRDWGILGY